MIGIVASNGGVYDIQELFDRLVDEFTAASRGVGIGKKSFEFLLNGAGCSFEDSGGDFGFASRPGRFIRDEVTEEPGVIFARVTLFSGGPVNLVGELRGEHVRKAQIARLYAPSAQDHD